MKKLKRSLLRLPRKAGDFFLSAKTGRILVLVCIPVLLFYVILWEPEKQPPIFDAQVHYNQDDWARVSTRAILNTAEELNIPWLLVGSTPNEGTWRLYEADPARVIPMFIPQRSREDRDSWFNDTNMLHFIEDEITHKHYRGIGEFFLFDSQVDTPVVRRMVELAVKNRLVLHARSDPNALQQLFELGPSLRILWAHAGMFTQPETISSMLERYPYLWVELSHRGDVAPAGKLSAEWRELLLRYPDRFLLGSGTYNSEYWYQFRYIHTRSRGWLKDLPPLVAERIAFHNGLDLFQLQHTINRQ